MWSPWIRFTSEKRFERKSTARPEAMISSVCPASSRCSSTTRDRIAWPIPSPTTPYRIFTRPIVDDPVRHPLDIVPTIQTSPSLSC
jgi:hypothetical protein